MAIAKDASKSQIVRVIWASVLQANNVIDLAPQKGVVFMDETVLTALFAAGGNKVRTSLPMRSLMGKELPRPGLGQPNYVLQLHVVIQFRFLIGRKTSSLLSQDQIGRPFLDRW
jgi:hypothetical protein